MIKYVYQNKKTGRKVYLAEDSPELQNNKEFERVFSVRGGLKKNKVTTKCIQPKQK